jgi:hypothetical protein
MTAEELVAQTYGFLRKEPSSNLCYEKRPPMTPKELLAQIYGFLQACTAEGLTPAQVRQCLEILETPTAPEYPPIVINPAPLFNQPDPWKWPPDITCYTDLPNTDS